MNSDTEEELEDEEEKVPEEEYDTWEYISDEDFEEVENRKQTI